MDTYGFARTYLDFDELSAEARAWDLELVPTQRGAFQAHLALGRRGPVQLARARFERGLIQRGAPPAGHWTFVVPDASSKPFRWRGREVLADQVLIFPLSGELHSASPPGFHVFTVAVEAEHLTRVAHATGLPSPSALIGSMESFRCPAHRLRSLRRTLEELSAAVGGTTTRPDRHLRARLVDEVPRHLLELVDTFGNPRSSDTPARLGLAHRLDAFLVTEAGLRTSRVRALRATLGTSERTLRRVCQESYGCSPKELLQSHRLNAVRRMLRHADPATTRVTDVAGRYGFWHMGQFAADYRRRFGELPSHTLTTGGDKTTH